ncbi:MAG: hypothetical protein V4623_02065, partial [Pseudomonadota bacterium]
TNTVEVNLEGKTHPVDTGFLVFNEKTYPNLLALFAQLEVAHTASEMSFSVSLQKPHLAWAGRSLATVFAQKRNLLRPQFWRMLIDILRFNRNSQAWLAAQGQEKGQAQTLNAASKDACTAYTLADFLQQGGYSQAFRDWYLLPMAAAIWSCPTQQVAAMPLLTFIRFCQNHGLLQVFDRPAWRTVLGGGRSYVRKMASQLAQRATICLSCPVRSVRWVGMRSDESEHSDELSARWSLIYEQGGERQEAHFDQLVLACHSDQSLAILDQASFPSEHTGAQQMALLKNLLAKIRYEKNRAVLHTDTAVLPADERLWSAWNYQANEPSTECAAAKEQALAVSYLINRLQPLPFTTPVIVTLNPPASGLDTPKILAEFDYAHPVFDAAAIAAQQQLHAVQGLNGLWLAGAWCAYGFHEDGLKSALVVANAMGVLAPWQLGDGLVASAKRSAN